MSDGAASLPGSVESLMLEEEPDTPSSPRTFRFPRSYAELIADWPLVVVGVCTLLIVVCTAVVLRHASTDFDFGDELMKGFNTRGTTIGKRLVTWENLPNHMKNYPYEQATEQAESTSWSEDNSDGRMRQERSIGQSISLCGWLGKWHPRLVFTSVKGENMWNTRAIQSMCRFYEKWVSSHRDYPDLCEKPWNTCCPSWTLGNYIANHNNKASCQKITEQDVNDTLTTLRSCAPFYRDGTLGSSCNEKSEQQECSTIPNICSNTVYQIFHYLVDKDFLNSLRVNVSLPPLRYSMLFLPIKTEESMENIYLDNLENRNLSDGITTVTGMELYLLNALFTHYVVKDAVYLGIAVAIVLLVLCVYTRSMCITFMTMITIISSLTVSYFLYRVVFSISFFPFLNLITFIVLLGIGADDAFVLCDAWNYAKYDRPDSQLSETVSVTLRHAALSMFVTSFTTAAAFYTNLMSDITAIRCFGVFAGTAILVNYVLMVTWMPAVVVLHERYLSNLFTCVEAPHCQTFAVWTNLSHAVDQGLLAVSKASRFFFEKALPVAVTKLRYLWLLFFSALMLGGVCVVFVNPKMKLPSRELDNLQVFHSSHPFERYSAEYKKLFEFESDKESEPLTIRIIWGFLPIDNGDPLNPNNTGTLTPDTTFDITSPASQEWILNFCQNLRNQSFVSPKQDSTSCFMETFKNWMESITCLQDHSCCNQTFPYRQDILENCIRKAIKDFITQNRIEQNILKRLHFDSNDIIQAIMLEFQSTKHYSRDYQKMHQFYSEVDAWILKELRDAPQGLRNGWFHSDLGFYDLQNSLLNGTMIGMAVSVVLAFAVMLLTTRNIIISLYAMISIAGTIFVTVGALVLLGWELNLVESLAISVSLGLSVDFAVHYGVAYCLAPGPEREGKVVLSLSRMGLAIAMAALTTFVAGAMMMPCTIVPFTLMGAFLMLIMCASWAFATFFFQSLCRCLGPQGTFGQIPLPKKLQCFSSH